MSMEIQKTYNIQSSLKKEEHGALNTNYIQSWYKVPIVSIVCY